MTVAWCDGGDSAPELYDFMARVEKTVPHFERVRGIGARVRRSLVGDPTAEFSSWTECCNESVWQPMMRWVKANQVRYLIRGTRANDPIAYPLPNHVEDGIRFLMPLWHWSDEDLFEQLAMIKRERGLEPVYPHDCLTCPVTRICDRPELRNVA